ncbi:MAG: hypothetical protein H7318_08310 [Oligoflexus sp.]|nr:hypothetical protein [Oligoflexus sp.]
MKLLASPSKNIDSWILEYDFWATATLGEIDETDRFQKEMEDVVMIFDELAKITDNFDLNSEIDFLKISEKILLDISEKDVLLRERILCSLAKTLFLVTAKSDNNAKCRFPLFLRKHKDWSHGLPAIKGKELINSPIPKDLTTEAIVKRISKLIGHPHVQGKFLAAYLNFIVSEERHKLQLISIGHSYVFLRSRGRARELLSPMVAFQVRGSVAALAGHHPENNLRRQMATWGLRRGIDFNITDVISTDPLSDADAKTRAYDFVLPFQTPNWSPKIYIQSQFYAGDSGSVSHKNIDQTTTSRGALQDHRNDAIFLEFVDGAGYSSSLNGDLRRIFQFVHTKDFFQLRSAAVKLRRELQEIGFLTPLDFEIEVLKKGGVREEIKSSIVASGYNENEFFRVLKILEDNNTIFIANDKFELTPERIDFARKFMLLTLICNHGRRIANHLSESRVILVPGYEFQWGINRKELEEVINPGLQPYQLIWMDNKTIDNDLTWLENEGFVWMSN